MSFRRQLLHGTIWTAMGVYGSAGIAFLVTVVLARLLQPADFGVIAAIVTLTAFIEAVVDLGIGSSIVQRRDATPRELSTIFWSVLAVTVLIYSLLVACANPLARLLEVPLLPRLLPIVALNAIAFGLLTVPLALSRQRQQFKKIAVVQTIATAAAGMTAVALAVSGYGYYALIAQSVLGIAVRTAGMWIVARWWPRLRFHARDLVPLLTYSGPLLAGILINVWSRSLDAIFIARLAGVTALGHYSLASRIVAAPMLLITAGVRPQLHPLFATIRHDPPQVRQAFRETVAMTALVSFSLAAVLWVVAEPFVLAVWGPTWAPTITIVRAFGFLMAVQPINSLTSPLFLAEGKTGLMLRLIVVNSVMLIVAMALGAIWLGAAGVAWAYSIIVATVAMPRAVYTAYVGLFGGKITDLTSSLGLPAVFAASILTVGTLTNVLLLHLDVSHALRLVAVLAAALLALLLAARLLAWDLVRSVVRTLRER